MNGALADYDKAIQLKPSLAEAFRYRGSAKQVLGDYDGALADYNQATRLKPQLAQPCLGRNNAPAFFTNPPPQDYTTEGLAEVLRENLPADDLALVVNPLAASPEIGNWARQLTLRATNDLQKARTLYGALLGRLPTQPPRANYVRTAQEVFSAWKTPGTCFSCLEFSYLYVAVARAAGLKAYWVSVEEDCVGRKDSHACAAVFVGGKWLLIDLPYECFGAPRRRFVVMDDLQAAAVYLCAMGNLRKAVNGSM